ncbi:MAG: hypothetical protein IKN38_06280 [Clostridia bacterium]|nr:hypothetical protein [Clostridia bacterium]
MKRIMAVLLTILMTLPVLRVGAESQLNVPDRSSEYSLYRGNCGQVYELKESAGQETVEIFDYDVPEGGAAVILFFNASGSCRNSNEFISGLVGTLWAYDECVNLIAVDSYKNNRETVKSFSETYDASGAVDHYYYNPQKNYLAPWYLESVSRGGDMGGVTSFKASLIFVHALIITESDGAPVIRYSLSNLFSPSLITTLLGELIDIPDGKNDLVEVKYNGVMQYDNVLPVLALVNGARAEGGEAPLELNGELTDIAMERAAECAVYYSHLRPNAYSCFSINDGKYTGGLIVAENIASGHPSPEEAFVAWMNSTRHHVNIMKPAHTQIGIGCVTNNGQIYWVQLFGNGEDSSPQTKTEPVERQLTVETLESHLSVRMPTDDIVIPLCSAGVDCAGQIRNKGIDVDFIYCTAILSRPTEVLGSDGAKIAYVDESGVLHPVSEGEGVISAAMYEGDEKPYRINLTVTEHEWDGGRTVAEPTEGFEGLKIFTCASCGATREEILPKIIPVVPGDTDGDGALTLRDISNLRGYLICTYRIADEYVSRSDMNGDGAINAKDVLLLKKTLTGAIQ